MIAKLLASCIILSCAYIYGKHSANAVINKGQRGRELLCAMYFALGQLERKMPTDVMISRLSATYPKLFHLGESCADICRRFEHDGEDGAICAEFFSYLGKTDTMSQIKELEYITERMKAQVDELSEKSKRDARLRRLIPLFFASLVLIVLL